MASSEEKQQPMEEGEGGDEEEEDYNDSEEDTELQKAKQALTGRGVTLSDLMDEGIIHAGENLLSIDYRGQRFEADLLDNGKIKWHGAQEEFCTPSAWATHCKRLVNPIKRSGCGWASVKYKGRKLDTWKSIWSRRHHPGSPFRSTSPHQAAMAAETLNGSTQASAVIPHHHENGQLTTDPPATPMSETADTRTLENTAASSSSNTAAAAAAAATAILTAKMTATATLASSLPSTMMSSPLLSASPLIANGMGKISRPAETVKQSIQEEGALNLTMSVDNCGSSNTTEENNIANNNNNNNNSTTSCGLPSLPHRSSVPYSSLGPRSESRDLGTYVKCEHFEEMNRSQPFNVTVSTNALLLMDFHSHLTTSEVVGYLGGSWCPETHNVRISQAFPCKCLLSDKDMAGIVEEEIRQNMERQGCSVVGWYHSHPLCQPDPSLRDVDCQMHHQVSMKGPGGIYLPCIGLILSSYDCRQRKAESSYESFWVMPPPEDNPQGYGRPMHVSCIVHQSSSLSEVLLHEMSQLADFYRGFPTRIRWRELWSDNTSYLEKMKKSLRSKLPKDQTENSSFFSFLQQLLIRK